LSSTVPAPALPVGRRLALLIAATKYEDIELPPLSSPAHDVAEMQRVLGNPDIGNFSVTSLLDRRSEDVRFALEDFLASPSANDLLLLYLSCHGVRDKRNRLYFAAVDSRKTHLAATGLDARWLLDLLDECRAKRQILILDCCYSGAFTAGAKGSQEAEIGQELAGSGRGRVVLTASRAGEQSFEGAPSVAGRVTASVFTAGLVEGLSTGAADTDRDGLISVDDAYKYAYDYVHEHGGRQNPQRSIYQAEDRIWLARSPGGRAVEPAVLPEALRAAINSQILQVRLGAVSALGEWLAGDDAGRTLAARAELNRIAATDAPEVATAARALTAQHTAATVIGTLAPDTASAVVAVSGPAAPPRALTATGDGTKSVAALVFTLQAKGGLRSVGRGGVRAVSFVDKGLAAAGQGGKVWLWNEASGELLRSAQMHGPINALCPGPLNSILVAGGYKNVDRLNLQSYNEGKIDKFCHHGNDTVRAMLYVSSGMAATTGDNGMIQTWGERDGSLKRSWYGQDAKIYALTFPGRSAIGKAYMLASGGSDGVARLWDPSSGELLHVFPGNGSALHAVTLSDDGTLLACAGDDGVVQIWDTASGGRLGTLGVPGMAIRALAMKHEGNLLAAAGDTMKISLWNPRSGELMGELSGHTGSIRGLDFQGQLLASASDDATVRVWRISATASQ
jgi:hypothetical protein